jgi:hypothetical protein
MTPADQAKANAMHCEAKKHAYRQTQDGVVVSFVLHPNEVPDGLATAPLGSRYVLALVQIDENELPVKQKEAPQPDQENPPSTRPAALKPESEVMPNQHASPAVDSRPEPNPPARAKAPINWREVQPAAQAAMQCDKPEFWAFLREEHGYRNTRSPDDAADAVRHFCDVESRAELSTNHRKRVLWKQLDDQYQAWLAKERYGA